MSSCRSLELNNSKNGGIFTPYMGCIYSFWSYFNSESGVNILGTGMSSWYRITPFWGLF